MGALPLPGPAPDRTLCNSLSSAILTAVASQLHKLTGHVALGCKNQPIVANISSSPVTAFPTPNCHGFRWGPDVPGRLQKVRRP